MACGLALGVASGAAIAQTAVGPAKPDIERGQQLYLTGDPARGITTCVACHGPAGEHGAYLPAYCRSVLWVYCCSIKKLQVVEGTTQSHRRNANAMLMAPIVAQMTPEDIADLALYVSSLELNNPAIAG